MSYLIITACISALSFLYWYLNRHKTVSQMSRELRMLLEMQAVGAAGLLDDKLQASRNHIEMPDMTGKVAVITGGGRGIGLEVVKKLLNANATVVMGLRDTSLAKKIAPDSTRLFAYALDLKSLKSVKKFADQVSANFPAIHLLVNNGGVMYVPYELTDDGIETHFAVNYLSHFYLTHLLLSKLKAGGTENECSRVVNVSSCAHYPAKIYFEDINFKNGYDPTAAYAQSKLAQILSARHTNTAMEQEGEHVRCYSVHPGIVNTELFSNTFFSKIPFVMKLFFKTPEQGAISILYACVSKDIENKGGLYISNCREGFSSNYSKYKPMQNGLYLESCEFVGIHKNNFGKI